MSTNKKYPITSFSSLPKLQQQDFSFNLANTSIVFFPSHDTAGAVWSSASRK